MGVPIIYDKPFLTYDELLTHLQDDYGLKIVTPSMDKKALSTLSYYDLVNGYQECMMQNGKFKPGISFSHLYHLHLIDKDFQNIILSCSLIAENAFKNKLAYALAKNYGVDMADYLHKTNYKPAHKKDIVFSRVVREIHNGLGVWRNNNFIYTQQPTKHYVENHNHVPPWILLKNMSFGNAINLYVLLKETVKEEVTNEIITANMPVKNKISIITSALNLIRKYRNVVAHNLKFITFRQNKYKLPYNTVVNMINDNTIVGGCGSFNDIYGCLLAIYLITNDTTLNSRTTAIISDWYDFAENDDEGVRNFLKSLYDEYHSITGIPTDLKDRLKKLSSIVF